MTCRCGREWTHCKLADCNGSRNVYRKKFESNFKSQQAGHPVDVYQCKKCGQTFDSDMECMAPMDVRGSVVAEKPPQFLYEYGSEDYMKHMARRVKTLTNGRRPIEEVVQIMKLEGWKVELREAPPLPQEIVSEAPEPIMEPQMSLEDILAAMKGAKK